MKLMFMTCPRVMITIDASSWKWSTIISGFSVTWQKEKLQLLRQFARNPFQSPKILFKSPLLIGQESLLYGQLLKDKKVAVYIFCSQSFRFCHVGVHHQRILTSAKTYFYLTSGSGSETKSTGKCLHKKYL